jgi:antitoxin component YwqK of YwqJK toxin-antitoxin module
LIVRLFKEKKNNKIKKRYEMNKLFRKEKFMNIVSQKKKVKKSYKKKGKFTKKKTYFKEIMVKKEEKYVKSKEKKVKKGKKKQERKANKLYYKILLFTEDKSLKKKCLR